MADAPATAERRPRPGREAILYEPLAKAGAADGRSLEELRHAALEAYDALPVPTWRRSGFWTTTLRHLDLDALAPPRHDAGSGVPAVVAEHLGDEDFAGVLVQRGASVVSVTLDPALAQRGVVLCSLEDAARDHAELFTAHYLKRLPIDRDKFLAGNAAFWTGGAFLHVPDGVQIERPFAVVYVIDEPGTAQYAHTLVVAGESADFALREYDLAPDFEGQALHAGAFECYLGGNARARIAHYQDWGAAEIYDVSTHFVRVGRDGFCSWIPIHLGGHLTRQHLELATAEQGSDMRHRGIYFTEGDEHLDLYTVDYHEVGHTTGDTVWKGAATGASRASYEGLIKIDSGAQETHTYLQTHSMMLSPKAKVDAIPSLIVETDSVSASHGGTVGEVDEDAIFYMRARGYSRPEAIRVLIEGYFEPVVGQLGDAPLEALVRRRITDKLSAAAAEVQAYSAQH